MIDRRVLRGAKLLDERMPGWEEKIDLEHFWLQDGCLCILGQLYNHYSIGCYTLFEESFPSFNIVEGYGFFALNRDVDVLEKSWRILIAERLYFFEDAFEIITGISVSFFHPEGMMLPEKATLMEIAGMIYNSGLFSLKEWNEMDEVERKIISQLQFFKEEHVRGNSD